MISRKKFYQILLDKYLSELNKKSLREKCLYSELLWSVFSRIRTDYRDIRSIIPYLVRKRENEDQINSEYEHFLRSEYFSDWSIKGRIFA